MNTNDRKFKGLNISIWSIKLNSNFHKWRHSHAKKCLQFFQNFRKSLTCQKTPKTFLSLLVISSKLLEYSRLTDWCFPAYCWDTPVTYLSPPVCPYCPTSKQDRLWVPAKLLQNGLQMAPFLGGEGLKKEIQIFCTWYLGAMIKNV